MRWFTPSAVSGLSPTPLNLSSTGSMKRLIAYNKKQTQTIQTYHKQYPLHMDSTYQESGPDVTNEPIGTVVDHRCWHRLHQEDILTFPDQSLLDRNPN